MSKFITIGQAAKYLGVSPQTLRRWERQGRIAKAKRTSGGQRRYELSTICHQKRHSEPSKRKTIAYARVF